MGVLAIATANTFDRIRSYAHLARLYIKAKLRDINSITAV